MNTKAAALLLLLSSMAAMLASLAILPLQLPGFMAAEGGGSAPVDEAAARAASAGMTAAAAALWHACVLARYFQTAGRLVGLYAAASVAFAAYSAWEAAPVIAAWLARVDGPLAGYYRLAVAAPATLLLCFGALHVLRLAPVM